jgi:UDP-hydrolysing UDP-N-acetyl-D-glucosamine 2-epimerase
VLYGDRLELLPIATAAVIAHVPIAHVSGGDITEGAIDEQVRHALTKMAHLHFPHTPGATRRVLQMGEEPWRVTTVGDPLLDAFVHGPRPTPDALADTLGFVPDARTLVVTFHPPTLELDALPAQLDALCTALNRYDGSVVITAPAPDPGADMIRESLTALARSRPRTVFVESLGGYRFRGLLHCAGAVVGNSSSGLIEAPAAQLGAVNLGARQHGRERAANVIDAPLEPDAITAAIHTALSPAFRASLAHVTSPYGRGDAAPTIARTIARALSTHTRDALLRKRFTEP